MKYSGQNAGDYSTMFLMKPKKSLKIWPLLRQPGPIPVQPALNGRCFWQKPVKTLTHPAGLVIDKGRFTQPAEVFCGPRVFTWGCRRRARFWPGREPGNNRRLPDNN
ncbi:hypothetical protein [Desulfosudis oleivorans]|uniref:hypothetical protein n=1 Tax=Desulfosudis oleivorans TaxID=181663 RepID=UPI00129473E7|nr:hypothetical protein [Desulfosudis oleivorans]